MKGTEKQVRWAEEIKKEYVEAVELFKATFTNKGSEFKPGDEGKIYPVIDKALEKLEDCEAGKLIDIRYDIDKIWDGRADQAHDAKDLATGTIHHVPAMVFDMKGFQISVARATAMINRF